MRLLDLFCGAGGASMGYHRAGFEVVGVDHRPQPNYPFEFHQADAMTYPLDGFDVIHASPPCQQFSRAKHLRDAQGGTASGPDLVDATRGRLVDSGKVYVIENVPGAPLHDPLTLCGSSFDLRVRRHRLFESNVALADLEHHHREQGRPVGVYHKMNDDIPHGGRTARTLEDGQDAMRIDWMNWKELTQSIPPAYTAWIGSQLLQHESLKGTSSP